MIMRKCIQIGWNVSVRLCGSLARRGGGRYINYADGMRQYLPAADAAGKLYWYGKFIGNMYKDFKPGRRVFVDCLIGGQYELPRFLS